MTDTHTNGIRAIRRPGFTLIELLVVIVIIGILAGIAIVRYGNVREQAWTVTLQADMRSLAKHQELHHMTNETYATLDELEQYASSPGTSIEINHATASGWSGTGTHDALGDRVCGIFVGDAPPAGGAPATTPEVLACTDE